MELQSFEFMPLNHNNCLTPSSTASQQQQQQQDQITDNTNNSTEHTSTQLFRVFLADTHENIHLVVKASQHIPSNILKSSCHSNHKNHSLVHPQHECTYYCHLIKREWDILQQAHPHPNIINAYKYFQGAQDFSRQSSPDSGCCAILMEEAQMDLYDFVAKQYLPNKQKLIHQLLDLYRQVAEGLEHIHSLGFAHNDIKSENILIFEPQLNKAKLADFGLANNVEEDAQQIPIVRTRKQLSQWKSRCLSHAAPEILMTLKRKQKYFNEQRADVFAFGVSLFESLFGFRPFYQSSAPSDPIYSHFANSKKFYSFWNTNPQIQTVLAILKLEPLKLALVADVLHRCLLPNPELRLSSQELLTHRLFD